MLSGHALAMWFERRLATVNSAKLIVFSLFAAAAPGPLLLLIKEIGWRSTYPVMGLVVVVALLPLVIFFYRNTPEEVGQHLDGDRDGDPAEHEPHEEPESDEDIPGQPLTGSPTSNPAAKPKAEDPAFTLGEAVRTWAFWLLVPVSVLSGLIGTAVIFHLEGLMTQAGVGTESPEAMAKSIAGAVAAWPICSAVAMLGGGILADRVKARWLLPLSPGLLVVTCVLWILVLRGVLTGLAPIAVAMGVFGLSQGIGTSVGHPAIARYFGRKHHGSIRGAASTATVAGTAAGPAIAGNMFDMMGQSFIPAMITFIVMTLPLAIATLTLKPPKRPDRSPDTPDQTV